MRSSGSTNDGAMHTQRRYKELATEVSASDQQSQSTAGVPYAEALHSEIINTINSICKEKDDVYKIICAARQLANFKQAASIADIKAVDHRFQTTSVRLRVQRRKRVRDGLALRQIASSFSFKSGGDGVSFLYINNDYDDDTDNDKNLNSCKYGFHQVKQWLIAPEHFLRKHRNLHMRAAGQSIWDGSDFKLALLTSLRKKLLLKYLFASIRHESFSIVCRRQAAIAAARIREKKLLTIFFKALLLEALTVHYIDHVSGNCVHEFVRKKFLPPAMKRWRKRRSVVRAFINNVEYTDMYHNGTLGKIGINLLLWNVMRGIQLKIIKKWADKHPFLKIKARALQAWQLAFVKKSIMRINLEAKVSATLRVEKRMELFIDPPNFEEIKSQAIGTVSEFAKKSIQELRYNMFYKIYDRGYVDPPRKGRGFIIHKPNRYNNQFGSTSLSLKERSTSTSRASGNRAALSSLSRSGGGGLAAILHRNSGTRGSMEHKASQGRSGEGTGLGIAATLPSLHRQPVDNNSEPSMKPKGKRSGAVASKKKGDKKNSDYLRTGAREAFKTAFDLRNMLSREGDKESANNNDANADRSAGVVDSTLYHKMLFGSDVKSSRNSLLNRATALAEAMLRENALDDDIEGDVVDGDAIEYNIELNTAMRLVKKCAFYLKQFHRIRSISLAYRKVRRGLFKTTTTRLLAIWRAMHKKLLVQYGLCDVIYERKSQLRVLKKMRYAAIGVFKRQVRKLVRAALRNRSKYCLTCWVFACSLRNKTKMAIRRHLKVTKSRYLARWKADKIAQKKVERFKTTRLKPLFAVWRRRTCNARLLRRVFAILEAAWTFRLSSCTQVYCPTSFICFLSVRTSMYSLRYSAESSMVGVQRLQRASSSASMTQIT